MEKTIRTIRRAAGRKGLSPAAMILWLTPLAAQACPRCVDATPYKSGLQLAIAVLLPLPFALGYGLYRFLRRSFPAEIK